jgi:hypothetical protein
VPPLSGTTQAQATTLKRLIFKEIFWSQHVVQNVAEEKQVLRNVT